MGALEAGAEDAEEDDGTLEVTCGAYDLLSSKRGWSRPVSRQPLGGRPGPATPFRSTSRPPRR